MDMDGRDLSGSPCWTHTAGPLASAHRGRSTKTGCPLTSLAGRMNCFPLVASPSTSFHRSACGLYSDRLPGGGGLR